MSRWIGRVALVTGASAGIGAAICEKLVNEGMKVVGCSRNITKIQVKYVDSLETPEVKYIFYICLLYIYDYLPLL